MYKYLILFFLPISLVFAQSSDLEKPKDTTKKETQDSSNAHTFEVGVSLEIGRPTIELTYGQNETYNNEEAFPVKFAKNNQFMAKIGFAHYQEIKKYPGILGYSFPALFYSITNGDIDKTGENNPLNSNVNTLGFIVNDGYGYKLGDKFFLILSHGEGLTWSSLDFSNPSGIVDSSYIGRLDVFGDGVRFGEMFDASIKLRLIDNIGITAGYTENLIMPRHLFWYWTLGSVIQDATQYAATYFINSALETSPELVPILYFVLKNGISYGFNRLREKNMNWPFDTAAPLFEKNFNIGISFIF